MIKTQIFDEKQQEKMPRSYMEIQSSFLYCELAPQTHDVTCSKL